MVHFILHKVRDAPIVTVNYLQDSAVLPLLGAGHSEETHSARFPFLLFYQKLKYRNHTWYLHLPSRKNSSWLANTPPTLKRKTQKSTHVYLYCRILQQCKGHAWQSFVRHGRAHMYACMVEFYNNVRVTPWKKFVRHGRAHTYVCTVEFYGNARVTPRQSFVRHRRAHMYVCTVEFYSNVRVMPLHLSFVRQVCLKKSPKTRNSHSSKKLLANHENWNK